MWRALDSCFSAISRRNSPDASGLLLGVGPAREAKHDQGFDGPARVTEVSVNLKLGVQGGGSISVRAVSAPHTGHGFLGLSMSDAS
jgi:hypothetical protein